jgi:hypothetical protein
MEGAAFAVSILALAVTGVGWFVTYRLNVRTQRMVLVNSLTNEARLTLTDAIREFHEWCCDVHVQIACMEIDLTTESRRISRLHESRSQRLRQLCMERRQMTWLRRLEEYEPLFPRTANARIELLHMLGAATHFADNLATQLAQGVLPSQEDRDACGKAFMDILSLTWDLLIYLQNESIGCITGSKIAERQPADSTSVRLVPDTKGDLVIVPPIQIEG